MKLNWKIIAALSGLIGGLITYALTHNWKISLIISIVIFIVVILSNPERRYMKAFYIVLFPLITNIYFTIQTKTENFDIQAGLNQLDIATTAILGLIAAMCLILDFLERNGKLEGTFLSFGKVGDINGNGNTINQTNDKKYENQVGSITGDYNQVIQIILSDGEKVIEKLGTLISRLVQNERDEIQALEKRIASKAETLSDKRKIIGNQGIEIVRLKEELSGKQRKIEESEKRYSEIYLESNGKDYKGSKAIYPKALKALIDGDKEKALKILERNKLLAQKRTLDKEKQQQAYSWLLRAKLLKEEDKWKDELNECFDFAAEIFPNWANNLNAANHYSFIKKFTKAYDYYQICLQKAKSDYEKVTTLNNLGALQRDRNEIAKAAQSYEEALAIYRKLAEANPQTYLPYVADTLNNSANLQSARNEIAKAAQSYEEALAIYRKLAEANPQTYLPYVADTLNNSANLQSARNEIAKAAQSYAEALAIYRKLAEANPQTYLPDLATTLNNLGVLQRDKNEIAKAAQSYEEALEIRRKLAEANPQTYLQYVADTLNNLANIQSNKNEIAKAVQSCEEALAIYRKLAKANPQTYLPYVAGTLNNLGTLQRDKNEITKEAQSYEEALAIYRKLAEVNPQTYLPDVAMTKINMSIYYQVSKVNEELSIKLVDEAISNLLPFSQIPYIQSYLNVAFNILKDWEIDVEEHQKEKTPANNG